MEGTIPILRTKTYDNKRNNGHTLNHYTNITLGRNHSIDQFIPPADREYAHVGLDSTGPYYEAEAQINIWNPLTFCRECSFAQFWIAGPNTDNLSTVEAGLMATKEQVATTLTAWVLYKLAVILSLVITFKDVSIYNSRHYDVKVTVLRDPNHGNWWMKFEDEFIGYWPPNIFTNMAASAEVIT
ncbi:hypothetical protein L484_003119 [Morus notabilis]|uniref:Neprosin PEP catalytic domain-containing protein n=1 Tax=Morus notabilis TaxID=981085 RepID=W9S3X1_9ROSA|nr:hypothetical protein L484_003119 [Morus notabilis]